MAAVLQETLGLVEDSASKPHMSGANPTDMSMLWSRMWSQQRALAPSICIISAATETLEAVLCLFSTRWPPLQAPVFRLGRLPAF